MPAFFILSVMPKSRNRKKKGNKVQQIDVPRFLISSYNGTSMRVKNPNWKPGKKKLIKHIPSQSNSSDVPKDGG